MHIDGAINDTSGHRSIIGHYTLRRGFGVALEADRKEMAIDDVVNYEYKTTVHRVFVEEISEDMIARLDLLE